MHQRHPGLLCRAASQGHEGTSAFSCFNARGGAWGWRWWLHWMKGHLADVLTGSRNQGQDPHPRHGVPLRGRHAGHQTGLRQDLWEITLHWHFGQLPRLSVSRDDVGGHVKGIWHHLCFVARVTPLGITRSCCWSCAEVATKEGRRPVHTIGWYRTGSFISGSPSWVHLF